MRFEQFVEHLETIEEHASRWDKVKELSRLLAESDTSDLAPAIYLCQGRLADTYYPRQTDHIRLKQQQIASLLSGRKRHPTITSSSTNGALHTNTFADDPLASLSALYNLLHVSVSHLDAWLSRRQSAPFWLIELSRRMSAQELKWLTRILTGPLFEDEVIISALADLAAIGIGTQKAIEQAYKYTVPDLGVIATTLMNHGYWAVVTIVPRPGIPIKPEDLINFRNDIEAAWEATGPCLVQPKYDGWYVQIHKYEDEIALFDEKPEDLTDRLPDIVQACRQYISIQAAIFDSEIVGYDPAANHILSWTQTMTSKHHKVFIHDVIFADDIDWRDEPYFKRRKLLEGLFGADDSQVISAVYEEQANRIEHLRSLWAMWKDHEDFEGLIVKKPNGTYLSGRESKAKGKVTPRIALDTVVLGYTVSLKNVISILIGVWDEKREMLIPIATVEGAIIPKEVQRELWRRCRELEIRTKPSEVVADTAPRRWVRPRIVVEVETKGRRTRSTKYRHAGFTIWRKTNLRIRDNKSPEDADDIREFMSFPLAPGKDA